MDSVPDDQADGLTRIGYVLPNALIDLADRAAAAGDPGGAVLREKAMEIWTRQLWERLGDAA